MPKSGLQVDVLVLGEHPCAYLAAALLRHKTKLNVLHAGIPQERLNDRLVLVNPAFYGLHALAGPLRRRIKGQAIHGLQFVADEQGAVSEYHSKSCVGHICQLRDIRDGMRRVARGQGVKFLSPRRMEVRGLDEQGIELTLDRLPVRATALVVGGVLPAHQQRVLGMPEEWERGVVHCYTYARVPGARLVARNSRPLMPMSLDLRGKLCWGWVLPGHRCMQIAVEQPLETAGQMPPRELLSHWAGVLQKHGVLKMPALDARSIERMDLPLAGALAHEGLANRTLLIGPAGGFYSGCAEDVYPNCWSAVDAADVLKKALRERHLQDALQPYRQNWRTTLGDYLRGPQQNLRFLLPLVYRNQEMTNRLAEAILSGRGVVR